MNRRRDLIRCVRPRARRGEERCFAMRSRPNPPIENNGSKSPMPLVQGQSATPAHVGHETGGIPRRSMRRVVVVTCGILVGALWFAAFTRAKAAVPFQGGTSVAASALSDTIVCKAKGR